MKVKAVAYKEPVNTIPDGVWESSRPGQPEDPEHTCTPSTDLQGNGYPAGEQKCGFSTGRQGNAHHGGKA